MPCASRLKCVSAWTLALLLAGRPALASGSTISGLVTDPSGSRLPGVVVTATNEATNVEHSTATNGDGVYVLANLTTGRYRVTLQLEGFKRIVKPSVEVHVQDSLALNFQMELGSLVQSVTVEGGAPLVNTRSAAVSSVIDRVFVENLPLNGRTFQALIALSPGVVTTAATNAEPGQFSINGQRASTNYVTVDGVSANTASGSGSSTADGQVLAGSLPGVTALGSTTNLVSVDALQEFRLETSSYAPEFGRTPGGQISLVTRAGTNLFHGTAFEYFRDDALDANDWFANSRGLPKAALRQHDFGGVLGGPLRPDRMFFFVSYEDLRLRQPVVNLSDVPAISVREAAVPAMRPFLNAFPRPTGTPRATGFAEFAASYTDPASARATSVRIDSTLRGNASVFGRYSYSPSQIERRGGSLGSFTQNTVQRVSIAGHAVTGGVQHQLGRRLSHDLRMNVSRNRGTSRSRLDTLGGAVIPDNIEFLHPPEGHISSLGVAGGLRSRISASNAAGSTQQQFNMVSGATLVAGNHALKVGFDYRYLFPRLEATLGRLNQNITFASMASASVGLASTGLVSADNGPTEPRYTNLSVFAQDAWQATNRLTATYGVRWDYNPPPTEPNGRLPFAAVNADDVAALDFAAPGTPLYKTQYTSVAPRIGVAYVARAAGGSETVLRGGFGRFYDLGSTTTALGLVGHPNRNVRRLMNVEFPLSPSLSVPPAAITTPPYEQAYLVHPDLEPPFTSQWNAAIEQALGSSQAITVSYVGASGHRLLRQERYINPNPRFTLVQLTRNTGESDYRALQVQFRRRLTKGLQATAAYTWARSVDNASWDSLSVVPSDRIDPDVDRGHSDFDIRHAVNMAVTFNLPTPPIDGPASHLLRNWWIDALAFIRSAPPVNVFTVRDIGFGLTSFRPDLVPNASLYIDDPSAPGGRRINREAFAIPTQARQGTLPRNAVRGFGAWQVDLAVRRVFELTNRVDLQLRVESFNVFNRANFGLPNGLLTSTSFGESTVMLNQSLSAGSGAGLSAQYQIGGPRSTQLSIKLSF